MIPVKYLAVLSVAVVILAAVVVSTPSIRVSTEEGGDPSEDDDYPVYDPIINDLPDGFTYTESTHTVHSDDVVEWTIFDNYHTFMDSRYDEYEGYSVISDSISLDVGSYTITVGDLQFDVYVDGTVSRELSWKYSFEGTSYPVSVTYDIPMRVFKESCDSNREWNETSQSIYRYMQFSEMDRLVVKDKTIRLLESSLESEYVRIGGSIEDRQGYADFLACFVQLAIKYPPSVEKGSFDYYVWGMDEYWCVPLETLYHTIGDCEDTSALLCSLYLSAGFQTAMGGHSGHVFSGVVIDDFQKRTFDGFPSYSISYSNGIIGFDDAGQPIYDDLVYRAVETTKGQIPAGYLSGGNSNLGVKTFWGYAGFYPVSR